MPSSKQQSFVSSAVFSDCRFFVFLSLLIFLCYSNTFHVPFQLDDRPNILNNYQVHISDLLPETLWDTFFAKPFNPGYFYRPVAMVTFALNWYFGGNNPMGYHLVNILFHVLTAFMLYKVLLNLGRITQIKSKHNIVPFEYVAAISVLLWAVHPIQTQAVTYVVQRMAVIATFFFLLAMYFYIQARSADISSQRLGRTKYVSLCLLSFLLGCGAKENVGLLPFSLLLIEYVFFPAEDSTSRHFRIALWIINSILIIYGLYFVWNTVGGEKFFDPVGSRPFSPYQRVLAQQIVLLQYLKLLIYPVFTQFSIDHDVILTDSFLSSPAVIGAFFLHITLVVSAIVFRKKWPLFCFSILFFYINHLVESSFIQLELIFEHRNYLPSLFFFMPIVAGILRLGRENEFKNKLLFATLGSCLIIIVGLSTYYRNAVWQSEESLWFDAMQKAPESARSYARLGDLAGWHQDKNYRNMQKALSYYHAALEKTSPRVSFKKAIYGNIASVYYNYHFYDEAVKYYQKSLAEDPKFASSRFALAEVLTLQGKFSEALVQINLLLEDNEPNSRYTNLKGLILLWLDEPSKALAALQQALNYSKSKEKYFYNLGVALMRNGNYTNAKWFLERTRVLTPQDLRVYLSLLELAVRTGDEDARKMFVSEIFNRFSLGDISLCLKTTATDYRTVPLDISLIAPFIKEIPESVMPGYGYIELSRRKTELE